MAVGIGRVVSGRDGLDRDARLLGRGLGQDAVAEVEDVAARPGSLGEHGADALLEPFLR